MRFKIFICVVNLNNLGTEMLILKELCILLTVHSKLGNCIKKNRFDLGN